MRIGVDIGGSKIAAGVVQDKRILNADVVATRAERGKAQVLQNLTALIRRVWRPGVTAIGVGVGGVIGAGVVYNRTNLRALNGFNIGAYLRRTFHVPCTIENDAKCFALAEYALGQGRGRNPLVGVTLGTGFGVGIIINGKLFRGAHGASGECSNIPWERGRVDDLGSRALARYARAVHLYGTPEVLALLAREGNAKALRVFKQYGTALGRALSIVVNTLDPEMIVLGGAVSQSSRFFSPAMRAELRKWVYPHVFRELEVVQSKLEHAGVLGAGMLVRHSP